MLEPAFASALDALGGNVCERVTDPDVLLTFERVLRSDTLLRCLRAVLADDDEIGALAGTSQTHPNGFVKVPVTVTPAGTKLVVHGWYDRPGLDRDLHNHRWNFVSVVLRGELETTNHVATTDAAGDYVEFSYGSATDQVSYPLALVGRARLTVTGSESMPCGTVYAQDHSLIHGSRAVVPGTLTLILQAPASVEYCRVFRPVGSSGNGQRMVRPSRKLLRATLTEVAAMLSTRSA